MENRKDFNVNFDMLYHDIAMEWARKAVPIQDMQRIDYKKWSEHMLTEYTKVFKYLRDSGQPVVGGELLTDHVDHL